MKKISIGKRNLKTALSVFIALSFYLIFILLDIITGYYDGGFSGFTGLYTPFFAAIAAAYTSHKDYKSSLKQAKIRSVGSIFGGYFGMIIIILAEGLVPFLFPDINYIIYLISIYAFVSLGIIFLIYIIVKLKQ